LAGEPAVGVEHREAVLLQRSGDALIVEMIDDGVALGQDGSHVELPQPHGFPHAGNGLRQAQYFDRAQQCLRRIACPVMAFTADQAFLDQCHLEPFGEEVLRR
jgi:hypothetical protein